MSRPFPFERVKFWYRGGPHHISAPDFLLTALCLDQGFPNFLFIGTLGQFMNSIVYPQNRWRPKKRVFTSTEFCFSAKNRWRPKTRSLRPKSPVFSALNSKISTEARSGNPEYPGHLKTCGHFFVWSTSHVSQFGHPWLRLFGTQNTLYTQTRSIKQTCVPRCH